ncbi:hypothetical protein BJY52DRAFT_685069 [Lactarius psammicola]|nr:hypothetical protein BJY52DRAFT_685069 [Lactarius psammicola]
MCGPTSDGAACCIVANKAPVHDNKLKNQAIEFVVMGLPTDCPEAFAGCSAMDIVRYGGCNVWKTRSSLRRALAGMMSELSSCTIALLLTRHGRNSHWFEPHIEMELTPFLRSSYLTRYLDCAVDDARHFVEHGDNTVDSKVLLCTPRFTKLWCIVRREVCCQPERWTRG